MFPIIPENRPHSTIHIFPMTDMNDENGDFHVIDIIYDSIIPDAYPPAVPSGEFLHSLGPRIDSKL